MILDKYYDYSNTLESEQFNTLLLINDILQKKEVVSNPEFHILGGTALLFYGVIDVVTIDIDVANKLPYSIKQLVEPFLNDNASCVSLLPSNYISRLNSYREDVFTDISVKLLSLEDLFITKLWSWRVKDREDLIKIMSCPMFNVNLMLHILNNEICEEYRVELLLRYDIIKEVFVWI